jgi:hypothetical protein
MKRGDLQTTYEDAVCPTPGGDATGGGTSGGVDLGPGTPKESPNSVSGLPAAQTTVALDGGPGANGQVPMPPVASPGTLKGT